MMILFTWTCEERTNIALHVAVVRKPSMQELLQGLQATENFKVS
jgi:hypothetical protein